VNGAMNAEQLQDEVARALLMRRPPHERRIVLAVVMLANCSASDAAVAVDQAARENPWTRHAGEESSYLRLWADSAAIIAAVAKERATAKRSFVWWPTEGEATNVISCTFDARRLQDGLPRARVLSVKQVANIKRQRTMKAKERRDG
jgi:hypothetical protein